MRNLLNRLRISSMGATFASLTLFVSVALCGLALAGCGTTGGTMVPSGVGPSGPPSATISLCDSPQPSCTPSSTFSAGELRQLAIVVKWSNVSAGPHAQNVVLRLPEGNVYQRMETAFQISDSASGSDTTVQTVPVAGTFISQRSLTGLWTVEVSLDDQPVASQTFRFNQ
ncbi:MAG: hypothetical protein ACRD50_09855 [Candidatus Acidiferrales bacterium]